MGLFLEGDGDDQNDTSACHKESKGNRTAKQTRESLVAKVGNEP